MRKPALMMIVGMTQILSACERAPQQHATTQSPSPQTGWVRVDLSELRPSQSLQIQRAIEARDALAQTLKGELMSAIQSEGPVHAIDVCHSRAPQIADEVAERYGVQIGRTSRKLRNASNTGPSWMPEVIEEADSTPHAFADESGSLAVAYPIMLEDACVLCHGTDEQVPAPVRDAIRQRYPQDQATGFEPGDLRGWFWVQIPPEG